MKRPMNSRVIESNAKRGRKETGEVTQYSGSSFSDLPRDIFICIILRLSIKRILVCKSVCKTWYDLVSNPEFAKVHSHQAQVYPLIQGPHSRGVYLLQPDKDDFDFKLGMCDHAHSKSGCVCNVRVKLDTKYEILERHECTKPKKHIFKYSIVNSCNGLLCFFDPSDKRPPIVCNPVTGEFINLPKAMKVYWNEHQKHYGLGFSTASNQYKVIRMFRVAKSNSAQVHILGTEKWKCIGFFTQSIPKLHRAYLNGFLYWCSDSQPLSVSTFDIENECFGSISAPTLDQSYRHSIVGVLGEELCISGVLRSVNIHVWAWKDYGTEKAWSKVFSFDMHPYTTRHLGPFQPIKYLNDGALLMFQSYRDSVNRNPKGALLYMDPKRNQYRFLKIQGMKSAPNIISHAPSFVSLKHALTGQNVKVHNIMSRCAELKLYKEDNDIAIVEEEFYPSSDSDSSDSSDSSSDDSSDSESDFDSIPIPAGAGAAAAAPPNSSSEDSSDDESESDFDSIPIPVPAGAPASDSSSDDESESESESESDFDSIPIPAPSSDSSSDSDFDSISIYFF